MFGTILASLRDLFPAMPAAVIVRQEARWVGQSFWGWLWLDAFGVGLGTGCGRGEKIQGGKAATEAGCGFEEAACGLSPCHFCHLPFPPNMGEERWRDAWKKKYVSGQNYLSSLFSSPHIIAIILPPNSVRASSFEGVVSEKNRHRGGGGSKTSCFSCPAANCTTPTHHFHIFPHIANCTPTHHSHIFPVWHL